jgi:hypothetical protein
MWYKRIMKAALIISLFLSALVFADEASERAAIESVIDALNGPSTAVPTLFQAESTAELSKLADLDRMFQPRVWVPYSQTSPLSS